MKKPSTDAIRAARPLTKVAVGIRIDRMAVCNVCGAESDSLRVWRECDERDQPIPGVDALVFIGNDHKACVKAMEKHPRLYHEEAGSPGYFPALCGACVYRAVLSLQCMHKKLRANRGDGLLVHLDARFDNAILCGRGGRIIPIRHALKCEGRLKAE